MTKITQTDLQKLESYWCDIKKLKRDLRFREWELLNPYKEQDENIGGGKSNNITDTTFLKATALAEDRVYQNLKNIVETIESLYEELDDDQKRIVEMRYWDNNSCYEWEDIAAELYLTRYKVLKKRNAIIDRTANKLGWI